MPLQPGVYSDMDYNGESGDLIGIEVWLLRSGDGYVVVFQSSEGLPSAPVVSTATVEGDVLRFNIPAGNPYSGSTFVGHRDKGKGLVATFSNGRLGPRGDTEFRLKRGLSYWQK